MRPDLIGVYVAGPWRHKDEASRVKAQLQAAGIDVVSRWMDQDLSGDIYEAAPRVMRTEALRDVEDLENADVMLYLNLAKSEGKATELGMFLAWGQPIYVVGGTQNNVFLHLPTITHLSSVEEFIGKINSGNL